MGNKMFKNKTEPGLIIKGDKKKHFDPDEKWSNLYREREKNHLYRWVGVHKGGEIMDVYERDGEEGVLHYAEEKMTQMLHDNGEKPKTITYTDYLKWRKGQTTVLGITEDKFEVPEEKFRVHEALWRLNKRGIEGENILHLLLNRDQQVCYEIARILLKRYPGLVNDVYLGDERFGQTALHLAIVHDDYETVQLLLEHHADVNARACGSFFMPDDFKAKGKNTSYDGYAYYGEYPLAFAACFGNKDIYDLLIEYNADPNLQDSFGNTVLHMCVINYSSSMYSYAVRHWARSANSNIVNYAGQTPLTLATKLGRKDIFDEMLELMKVEFWRFSDMTSSAYPLAALDTIQPDGSLNYDSALMTVISGNTEEHLDMMGSEVIQRLLADKWNKFARGKMLERAIALVFHLIFLSTVVYMRPQDVERLLLRQRPFLWQDLFRTGMELIMMIYCFVFMIYQQGKEMRTQGIKGYFRNLKTAPAKAVYCVSNLLWMSCICFRCAGLYEVEEGILVFAVPGTWIFGLFFARSLKITGPFVQMIYSMIGGDLIRFSMISAIFLFSFSQVFYFLGKDMDAKQQLDPEHPDYCPVQGYTITTYSTISESVMALFRAALAGYDYEEFECSNYEALTKFLFVLYMFIMPIMMINILIAMMGNTYTTVIEKAEKAWRQQYGQILMVLEQSVSRTILARCFMEYSIQMSDHGNNGRGLMVVKQTKKTRASQRKQAVANWKDIGKKVITTIEQVGSDQAMILLHGHNRLEPLLEEHIQRDRSRSPRVHTSRRLRTQHTLMARSFSPEIPPDVNALLSAPQSFQSEIAEWQPNVHTVHEESENDLSVHSPPAANNFRTIRIRGADMVPHVDMPNMPHSSRTPPQRGVSPKIRQDMWRKSSVGPPFP